MTFEYFLRHATRVLMALSAAALILFATNATAQVPNLDPEAGGIRYLIAFPDTVNNRLDPRFPNNRVGTELSLWMYSSHKNKVVVSYAGAQTVVNLEPGIIKPHVLTGIPVVDVYNAVSRSAVSVESDFPIILYCTYVTPQGAESFTPIPIETWGTKYRSASVPGENVADILPEEKKISTLRKAAPATIVVIAAFDSTRVRLTPPAGYRFNGSPPAVVMLNEGEVYQVAARVDTSGQVNWQDDIAGTIIVADKPVGVVTGNTRAGVDTSLHTVADNVFKGSLAEWIPPADQCGTEFVYMPTMDSRRPGIGANPERAREYVRIHNPTSSAMSGTLLRPGSGQSPFNVKRDSLGEFVFGVSQAVWFKTALPAMAMMHSSAVVKFNGSTPCSGGDCLGYSAWASYMVEMTPREQWVNFAPYFAPPNPGSMEHYVNVVTDTVTARALVDEAGNPVTLGRRIAGTDLVWDSWAITPGRTYWLHATNGGRFAGAVYGLKQGDELFRPLAAGPAEFEEYSAISYGYPLAPGRRFLVGPDSIRIDTMFCCCGALEVTVSCLNPDPVGLRGISLDAASVRNTMLVPDEPARLYDVIGRSHAKFKAQPIDRRKPAEATIIIRDRTGARHIIYYRYLPEVVLASPDTLDFGARDVNTTTQLLERVTSHTGRDVTVLSVTLEPSGPNFSADLSGIALPMALDSNESLEIPVKFAPDASRRVFEGRLVVVTTCDTFVVVVRGTRRDTASSVAGLHAAGRMLDARVQDGVLSVRVVLPRAAWTQVELFDGRGVRVGIVADAMLESGEHMLRYDGDLPSGVYHVRACIGERTLVMSVALVR